MTSNTLLTNRLFKIKAKQNFWLIIVSFLSFFITTTMPTVFIVIQRANTIITRRADTDYLFDNIFIIAITVGAALVISNVLFRYLNSKPEVDLYHSLPIKREKIFISSYILGIVAFIVPLLINALMTIGILFANQNIFDITLSLYAVQLLRIICFYIAFYNICIFGCAVTGNLFMSVATSIGFSLVINTVYSLLIALYNTFFDFYRSNYIFDNKLYTYGSIFNNLGMSDIQPRQFVAYGIYGVVFILAAYFVFKNRPSENASNPVALNIFKPIIKYIGVFSASLIGAIVIPSVSYASDSFIVYLTSGIIVAFIIHMIFEMLYEVDIKAGFRNLKDFAIISIAFTLLLAVIAFDILGYDTKTVKLEDIEKAEYNNSIMLENQDSIKTLWEYATYCATNADNLKIDGSEVIEFFMKDGSTFTRRYPQYLGLDEHKQIESTYEYLYEYLGYKSFDNVDGVFADSVKEDDYCGINGRYFDKIGVEDTVKIVELAKQDLDKLTLDYLQNNVPSFKLDLVVENDGMYAGCIRVIVFDVQKSAVEYAKKVSKSLTIDETPEKLILRPTDTEKSLKALGLEQQKIQDLIEKADEMGATVMEYAKKYPTEEQEGYQVEIEDAQLIEKYLENTIINFHKINSGSEFTERQKDIIIVYDEEGDRIGYIPVDLFETL